MEYWHHIMIIVSYYWTAAHVQCHLVNHQKVRRSIKHATSKVNITTAEFSRSNHSPIPSKNTLNLVSLLLDVFKTAVKESSVFSASLVASGGSFCEGHVSLCEIPSIFLDIVWRT
jgi:hypothetical protein